MIGEGRGGWWRSGDGQGGQEVGQAVGAGRDSRIAGHGGGHRRVFGVGEVAGQPGGEQLVGGVEGDHSEVIGSPLGVGARREGSSRSMLVRAAASSACPRCTRDLAVPTATPARRAMSA